MFIYALELNSSIDRKFYIGKTSNYNKRLSEHFNCQGSEWTKMYKPIKVIFVIEVTNQQDPMCTQTEDLFTQAFMLKYGWKNVRGGQYCQINKNYSYVTNHLKLYSSEKEEF